MFIDVMIHCIKISNLSAPHCITLIKMDNIVIFFKLFLKLLQVVWQLARQMSDFRPEYATLAFAEEAQTEKYTDLY